jgi:hypothetical protein
LGNLKNKQVPREVERGQLLRLLREFYPGGATFRTLLHQMDETGYSVLGSELLFHLRYMEEEEAVAIDWESKEVGQPERIRLVKITKRGIDILDGRKEGELGIRV